MHPSFVPVARGRLARLAPALLLGLLLAPLSAHAQIRVGGGGTGGLGGLGNLPGGTLGTVHSLGSRLEDATRPLIDDADELALAPERLAVARAREMERRLRRAPRVLQQDAQGNLVLRGELVAMPSGDAALAALREAGFDVGDEQATEGLDLRWRRLRVPKGQSLEDALALARRLDPSGAYDEHPIYVGAGSVPSLPTSAAAPPGPSEARPAPADASPLVGLVDTGVDVRHPALHALAVVRHGCGDGPAAALHPAPHGTAVAALLAGDAPGFHGAAPRARLLAADAFCDAPDGGSAVAVVRELGWLLSRHVPVVNVSLVGPPNLLLQRAVAQAVARGVVVVAPVGNDGPAAPPLYPAAWPGVVGVTGVDARRRLLAEAGRGPAVMFAAPGTDLVSAAGEDGYVPVRGTSFASPIVAGLLARAFIDAGTGADAPSREGAARAIASLARAAVDLGPPGRDDGYGLGLVGEGVRTTADAVAAASRRR